MTNKKPVTPLTTTLKQPTPTPPKKNYINNKDLLIEVAKSKKQSRLTEELAKMLMMLCKRYGTKGNYVNYTYNDDMQAYAMMMICRTWHKFNVEKSNNPFAFYTQCIKHSFIQYLNQEKRQRDIRDELLVDQGMNPSYNYQLEHASIASSIDMDGDIDSNDDQPIQDEFDDIPDEANS